MQLERSKMCPRYCPVEHDIWQGSDLVEFNCRKHFFNIVTHIGIAKIFDWGREGQTTKTKVFTVRFWTFYWGGPNPQLT